MPLKENIYKIKEEIILDYYNKFNSKITEQFKASIISKITTNKVKDDDFNVNNEIDKEINKIRQTNKISEIRAVFDNYLMRKAQLNLEANHLTIIRQSDTNFEFLHADLINDITFVYATTGNLQKDKKENIFTQLRSYFKTNRYAPVITISTEDLINISEENSEKYNLFTKLDIDRRFRFLDSSIWNYYLPLNDDFEKNLKNIIGKIKQNFKRKLYETAIAKEYIELQYRIAKNSYLKDFGGHASAVAPFVFHSESKMHIMAEKELEKLKYGIKNWKADDKITWNALLIDDYGNEKLKITEAKSIDQTKKEIILTILAEFIDEVKFQIDIETTNSNDVLKDAKKKIIAGQNKKEQKNRKVYDILFLDYLLDYRNDSSQREYGYEFLAKINNLIFVFNEETENRLKKEGVTGNILAKLKGLQNQEFKDIESLRFAIKNKIGEQALKKYEYLILEYAIKKLIYYKRPLGKFWVFPVTVFSTAMLDRLREQGISHLDDNWYISRGADPVNTPELFKYTLYHFLNLQLSEAINTKEDIINFIINNITDVYSSSRNDGKTNDSKYVFEIRQKARRLYGVFMHKFGLQEALKDDYYHGSAFAESVLKYMHDEKEDDLLFYERVRKLLYLVGFGTHSDAVMMWDLLSFINKDIKEYYSDSSLPGKIDVFLKNVAKYVSELKN